MTAQPRLAPRPRVDPAHLGVIPRVPAS